MFTVCMSWSLLALSRVQEGGYSQSQRFRLGPAAVGERRIIGRGGGEVPGLVGSVEAGAMPVYIYQSAQHSLFQLGRT
jgi:hypothetical protein